MRHASEAEAELPHLEPYLTELNRPTHPSLTEHLSSLVEMSLSNPLNLILIPPILYLLYRRLVPSLPSTPSVLPNKYDENVYNWMPARHPDVLCHKSYTPVELAELDGRKNPNGRICLAIMRVGGDGKVSPELERTVFDVSAGASFYGPGMSLC